MIDVSNIKVEIILKTQDLDDGNVLVHPKTLRYSIFVDDPDIVLSIGLLERCRRKEFSYSTHNLNLSPYSMYWMAKFRSGNV